MEPSRRRFIQVGIAGAALLAVGGVGLSLQGTVLRAPARPLRALDARSFSVLAALADRVCPGGDGLPGASEVQVAERLDDLLFAAAPAMAEEVSQALALLENALAGAIFDQRFTPFTAASPAAQDRVLERWRTSRLSVRRAAFKALVGLCNLTYWGAPETWPSLGYPGPPDFRAVLEASP